MRISDWSSDVCSSDLERRMQVRAYNHWASMLGERNFPAVEELEPQNLPDFGPYSVLLDFSMGIEDPAVQYLGDKLAAECDAEGVINRLSEVPRRSLRPEGRREGKGVCGR